MPDIETEGYEFFGLNDRQIRSMLIERLEYLMANKGWSIKRLADVAGLPASSLYTKLDRESTSQLTFLDLCQIAKAFDISIIQLLPLSEDERLQGGVPVGTATMLKMWDTLLSRSKAELELLFEIDKLLHTKKDE